MSEKKTDADKAPCLHQSIQYAYGRTTLLDTNVGVLTVKMTCEVCGKPMKGMGLSDSNVLKKRPFSPDGGLTICIPFIAEGETAIETPTLETRQ